MIKINIFKGWQQFYDSGQIGMGTEGGMPPPRTKKRLNSNQVRTNCILSDNGHSFSKWTTESVIYMVDILAR